MVLNRRKIDGESVTGPNSRTLRIPNLCAEVGSVLVLVGPAAGIHVLLKLSDGVIVTPAWEEANTTIASPPVLSKDAVVCVVSDVELI